MKAAVISLGSVSSKWIAEAMQKNFDVVDIIDLRDIEVNLGAKHPEVLYKGEPFPDYDCIYMRGSFRHGQLLCSITTALYDKTYMPIKANAFNIGHDKLLTQLELQRKSIPMPKTYISSTAKAAKEILEKVNYPIIMKFPHGTQGKGVMYADSFASASSMLDALVSLRQPFLIQEYIETGGTDIRLLVVGDKVVATMQRQAEFGEVRANIHAGGKGEGVEPDMHTKKLAIKTAEAIGAEICAVDILESVKGPLVIEVNLSPGLQGITDVTKVDVADKIAKYLYKKASERKEVEKKESTSKMLEDLGIKTEENGFGNEILTHIDLRGDRILLPEVISGIAKFKEDEEIVVKAKKGKILIKKALEEEKSESKK